jgi:hypothetical protein
MGGLINKYISNDVKHTFVNNIFKILTGPLSMVLIPLLLTKQMQGYWYSFLSISALAVLADLGFTTIVLQFSAHEFAHLEFNDKFEYEGSIQHFDRIASLFRFITKWGTYTVTFSFPIIFLAGAYIFSGEKTGFTWMLPWIFYLIGSGIKFYLNIVVSFFEGCSMIASIQKIKTTNMVITYVLNIALLLAGFRLYSLGISMLVGGIIFIWQVWSKFRAPARQLLKKQIIYYSWKREILNLLWRYTISWFSGYMMFNLFTPLAFKFYGSKFAGQVGITDALVTAIFSLANSWIYAINPKLNIFVSQRNWPELDKAFFKNLLKSIYTYLFFSICAILSFYLLSIFFHKMYDRFLNLGTIALLLGMWLLQLIINSIAVYSRAHKEEPYVIASLVTGIYVALSTVLITLFFPYQYFYWGFYSSFLFAFPWFYSIYSKRKLILHSIY